MAPRITANDFDMFTKLRITRWAKAQAKNLDFSDDIPEWKLYKNCCHYVDQYYKNNTKFYEKIQKIAYENDTGSGSILRLYTIGLRDHVLEEKEIRVDHGMNQEPT